MDKFKDKYRIPSSRLQNWDYGANAAYFITICTAQRAHYFGDIENGEMQLNQIGILAEQFWTAIPDHFPFIQLGNFVVMPNHVHGVLVVNKVTDEGNIDVVPDEQVIENTNRTTAAFLKWKPATISVIINQYKRIVTINARKIHADFEWQTRFDDHIIRNEDSFVRIQNYIATNPQNWRRDVFH